MCMIQSTFDLCRECRTARTKLLSIIANPNNEVAALESALNTYLAFLHGFVTSVDPDNPGNSKLRHHVKFRWTDTLTGNKTT